MADFITKLNYKADGHLITDEVITLVDAGKVHTFLHHNVMQASGIVVWTNPAKTGTQITDFTVSADSLKTWVYKITFGAGVAEGTYYVEYYSQGDENDADDVNRLQVEVSQTQETLFDIVGSAIFADSTQPLSVKIQDTAITVPVEVGGIKKEFLFMTGTNLGASAVFTSPTFDFIADKTIRGLISASTDGTLYIQESDDASTWTTVQTIAVTTATSVVISATTYYDCIQFSKDISTRFVRLVYVNGVTAQTRFLFNAYSSSM